MLKVSVAIRCPLRKMPSEPESTIFPASFLSLSLAMSAAGISTRPANPNRNMLENVTLLLLAGVPATQFEAAYNLIHNSWNLSSAGFHSHFREQVSRPTRLVQTLEFGLLSPQRPIHDIQ